MVNQLPAKKEQVEIPYGIIEYTALFKNPILEAWQGTGQIISRVLSALEPYDFKIEGVEVKTHPEKLGDHAISFKSIKPGITFTLQLGRLMFVAENADWSEAERILSLAKAGVDAVISEAKAEISSQRLILALHLQIRNKACREVMLPLLSDRAFQLLDGEVQFPGIILQREKASIVIDASLAFANGLFVKITREHTPEVSLEAMSKNLLADQEQLYRVLSLEGPL